MNATEKLHHIDSFKKINEVVERVAGLREAFGNELNIGVDFHRRTKLDKSKLKEL